MSVKDSVYESAVKGRQEFRRAYREARDRIAELEAKLEMARKRLGTAGSRPE